jgi:hypothetical protein
MDDTKMVTLASARLYALYLAGYDPGDMAPEDRADCKDAVQVDPAEPPAMMVWLDAKHVGLAVQFDLAHVVQVCAAPVVIPLTTLRAEGAKPALLDALEAARR